MKCLCAAWLSLAIFAGGAFSEPAVAEEATAKDEKHFLENLSNDAGDFFQGVGSFFADDVPKFFQEEVSGADSGPRRGQSARVYENPFALPPKTLKDRRSVTEAQVLLNAKGYTAGPEDGLVGRRTRMAIGMYQKDHHLRVTGQVTDHLLLHLKGRRPTPPNVAEVPADRAEDQGSLLERRDP